MGMARLLIAVEPPEYAAPPDSFMSGAFDQKRKRPDMPGAFNRDGG
jgi:hypothetical protein